MKRSHAPIFWLLFGAGGMLSALAGTALVLVTGLLAPLGGPGAGVLRYDRMLALAHTWLGKAFLLAVIALFAWHAAHRILCSVHDIGLPKNLAAKLVCYGVAAALTLIAAQALLAIGR